MGHREADAQRAFNVPVLFQLRRKFITFLKVQKGTKHARTSRRGRGDYTHVIQYPEDTPRTPLHLTSLVRRLELSKMDEALPGRVIYFRQIRKIKATAPTLKEKIVFQVD